MFQHKVYVKADRNNDKRYIYIYIGTTMKFKNTSKIFVNVVCELFNISSIFKKKLQCRNQILIIVNITRDLSRERY